MNILHLDSSILGQYSASRQLSHATVEHLQQKHPHATVTYYDLAENPLPLISMPVLTALRSNDISSLTEKQKQEYELAVKHIQELKESSFVVIGAPMYNFSVPAQLKLWIDFIAQAGLTFRYTETGVQGLVNDKPVYIISSRGGIYSGEGESMDSQERLLQNVLNMVGVTQISVIRAEGLALGETSKNDAISAALNHIHQL